MTKAARFIQVDMADRSEESGCRIPLSSSRCSCTAYKASGVKAFNKRIDRTRYRANFMQKIVSRYIGVHRCEDMSQVIDTLSMRGRQGNTSSIPVKTSLTHPFHQCGINWI